MKSFFIYNLNKGLIVVSRCILTIVVCLVPFYFCSCESDNFFDKYPPEIIYYQYDRVETTEFNQITLEQGVTDYTLKARVSAPNKLAVINVYRDAQLVLNIVDFTKESKDSEYYLSCPLSNISGKVIIRTEAKDKKGNVTVKEFSIN